MRNMGSALRATLVVKTPRSPTATIEITTIITIISIRVKPHIPLRSALPPSARRGIKGDGLEILLMHIPAPRFDHDILPARHYSAVNGRSTLAVIDKSQPGSNRHAGRRSTGEGTAGGIIQWSTKCIARRQATIGVRIVAHTQSITAGIDAYLHI